MALTASPPWSPWKLRVWPSKHGSARSGEQAGSGDAELDEAGQDGRPGNAAEPTVAGVDELPSQWLEQLASSGIYPLSYVEGAAHAMRLDVGLYREQLLAIETR